MEAQGSSSSQEPPRLSSPLNFELLPPVSDDHCPLTEAEIAADSLLDGPPGNPIFADIRLAANFLAGGLLTTNDGDNNSLDGGDFKSTFEFWRELLNKLEDVGENLDVPSLNRVFAQLEAFHTNADKTLKGPASGPEKIRALTALHVEAVKELAPGESYTLASGWSSFIQGGSGHALLITLTRREDGNYDMILHSSTGYGHATDGSLVASAVAGIKTRLVPQVPYTNISPDQLFHIGENGELSSAFFQSLNEMNFLPEIKKRDGFTMDDHVTTLEAYDPSRQKRYSTALRGMITGQRGGTCWLSVTKQLIRYLSRDLKSYKALMFRCKFTLLVQHFRANQQQLQEDSRRGALLRYTLKREAENLLRGLAKISKKNNIYDKEPLIPIETAKKAAATLLDIKQRTVSAEKHVFAERLKAKGNPVLESPISNSQVRAECSVLSENRENAQKAFAAAHPSERLNPSSPDRVPQKTSGLLLLSARAEKAEEISPKTLTSAFQAINHSSQLEAHLNLQLIFSLPLPPPPQAAGDDAFWSQVEDEELEKLTPLLVELMGRKGEMFSERLSSRWAAIFTIYCILHYAARRLHGKRNQPDADLDSYSIPHYMEYFDKIANLIFIDRQEFKRLQEVKAYFASLPNKHILFKEDHIPTITYAKGAKGSYQIVKRETNCLLWSALLATDKEFADHVEEKREKNDPKQFLKLPDQVLRLAYCEVNLQETKFRYIYDLRIASKFICELMNQKEKLPFTKHPYVFLKEIIFNHGEKTFFLGSVDFSLSIDDNPKGGFHYSKNHKEQFLKLLPQDPYEEKGRRKEETALADGNNVPPEFKKIRRAVIEPALAPYQLISEFSDPQWMSKLEHRDWRVLFFTLFLESPRFLVDKKISRTLGAGELIANDRALALNARHFIDKGIDFFLHGDLSIEGISFFLELAFYLRNYLVAAARETESQELFSLAEQLDMKETINGLLENESLRKNQQALVMVHFFRFLFYSISAYGKDDLIDIFESHFYVAGFWNNEDHYSLPFAMEKYNDFVLKICASADNIPVDLLLERLGITPLEPIDWKRDGELYGSTEVRWNVTAAPAEAHIDIYKGRVAIGPYHYGSNVKSFLSKKDFEVGNNNFIADVFNAPPYPCKLLEKNEKSESYLFEVKGWGKFKYSLTTVNGKQELYISQIPPGENEWYFLSKLPHGGTAPFYHDHLLWLAEDPEHSERCGYLTDLTTMEPRYELDSEGNIRELQRSGRRILPLMVEPDAAVPFINFGGTTLLISDKDRIEELVYWCFCSAEGNTLKFRWNEKARSFFWNDNREYFISSSQPQGFLGTISKTLHLTHAGGTGPDKLLVPFAPIEENKAPAANGELTISQMIPEPLSEKGHKLKQNSQQYFVYDLVNGTVVPTSLESRFFYAYILASQSEYNKAVALIKTLSPTERLSEQAYAILELIISIEIREDHPDAFLLRCRAALKIIEERTRQAREPQSSYLPQNSAVKLIPHYASILLQSWNNASYDCRMAPEEETLLINNLIPHIESDVKLLIHWLTFNSRLSQLEWPTEEKIPKQLPSEYTPSPVPIKKIFSHNIFPYKLDLGNAYKIDQFSLVLFPEKLLSKKDEFLSTVYSIAVHGSASQKIDLLIRLNQWLKRAVADDDQTLLSFALFVLMRPKKVFGTSEKVASNYHGFINAFEKKAIGQFIAMLLPKVKDELPKKADPAAFPIPKELQYEGPGEVEEGHPLVVPFKENNERWSWLEERQKRLARQTAELRENRFQKLHYPEDALVNGERIFQEALNNELEELILEINAGAEEIEAAGTLKISSKTAGKIAQEAASEREKIAAKRAGLMDKLEALCNKRSDNPEEAVEAAAKLGGGIAPYFTFEACISAFLQANSGAYKKHNRHLTDQEIEAIHALIAEILDLKSFEAQLSSIAREAQAISRIKDDASPERVAHCQNLETELAGRYHFLDLPSLKDKYPFLSAEANLSNLARTLFRTFAGQMGILPYPKQVALIIKMLELKKSDEKQYKDIVVQLLMGGGKTSVIALFLLYLHAKEGGKLTYFVVPPALFNVVCSNMSEWMQQAVNLQIESLNLEKKDLTRFQLEKTLQQLERAQKEGIPVITTPKTRACFELERRLLARKLAKLDKMDRRQDDLYKEEVWQRLQLVTKIIDIESDVLIDEVHLVLLSLLEVNIPDGELRRLKPERLDLVHQIFTLLLSEEITIEIDGKKASLSELTQLRQKKQSTVPTAFFHKVIAPCVARKLYASHPVFQNYYKGHEAAFTRFAAGKMAPFVVPFLEKRKEPSEELIEEFCPNWGALAGYEEYTIEELKEDYLFMKRLLALKTSHNPQDAEAAQLAGLARLILFKLLPTTLKKEGKRNYGIKTDGNDTHSLRLRPFGGVGNPNDTSFGYHWEEVCYSFAWASAFPISPEELTAIAALFKKMAKYYAREEKISIAKTAEYKEFERLFGVPFNRLKEGGNVKKAIEKLSGNLPLRLELQKALISSLLTYRTKRISYNAATQVADPLSNKGMSGTTSYTQGYKASMAENHIRDSDTNGKILGTMALRPPTEVLKIAFSTVGEFMEQIGNRTKEPVHGIIDVGGLFKKFKSHKAAAKGLARWFEEHRGVHPLADPSIEAVLFFHNDPGEKRPDTLYCWRIGADQPERIGGTSEQALQAKGLNPFNIFVYYDENHTTGTDIKQRPQAKNVLTFDEKTALSSYEQGIMRQRGYTIAQRNLIVFEEESGRLLINGGKSDTDILLSAAKEETISRANHMVRHAMQNIDELFIRPSIERLHRLTLAGDYKGVIAAVEEEGDNWAIEMEDDPLAQGGNLSDPVNTRKMLSELLDEHGKGREDLAEKIAELKEQIAKTPYPEFTYRSIRAIGTELENEVEVEEEQEQEKEQELQAELQVYQAAGGEEARPVKPWGVEAFVSFVEELRQPDPQVPTLSDHLSNYEYRDNNKQRIHYEFAFRTRFYGTVPFFYPLQGKIILPIFHKLQREAKQLLAIAIRDEEGAIVKMRWVLVAQHETPSICAAIAQLKKDNAPLAGDIWFVQPDGSPLIDSLSPFPEQLAKMALLEVNILCGNIDYLKKNSPLTKKWLLANTEVKRRFLLLRTLDDEYNKNLLTASSFFRKGKREENAPLIFRTRMGKENNPVSDSPEAIKQYPPAQIRPLKEEAIPHLGINWEERESDPATAEAIAQLNIKNQEEADAWTRDQLAVLNEEQLSHVIPWQVPFLNIDQVQHLTRPEQIAFEDEDEVLHYLLSNEQVGQLQPYQIELVRGVNPEHYSSLSHKPLIQQVANEHLDKLERAQWKSLKKEQVHELEIDSAEKLASLADRQLPWVQGNSARYFDPRQFWNITTREQIGEISDRETIEWLFNTLGTPTEKQKELITALPAEAAPHITEEMMRQCPAASILSQEGKRGWIPHLPSWYLKSSNDPNFGLLFPHLTAAQKKAVGTGNFLYLSQEQQEELYGLHRDKRAFFSRFEEGNVRHLKGRTLVEGLLLEGKPSAFQRIFRGKSWKNEALTTEQINQIESDDAAAKLTGAQILLLREEKIYTFGRKFFIQLQKVQPMNLKELFQHKDITPLHLGTIEQQFLADQLIPQIQKADLSQVDNYKSAIWYHASPEQIQGLKADVVAKIPGNALRHVKGEEQIRAIPASKVAYLSPEQFDKRTTVQKVIYIFGVVILGILAIPGQVAVTALFLLTLPIILPIILTTKRGKKILERVFQFNIKSICRLHNLYHQWVSPAKTSAEYFEKFTSPEYV